MISKYIQRGKSPKYSDIKKYPVIAQKCNQWSGFSIEKAKFIDPKSIDKYQTERILQNDDLLWNSTGLGTLGRVAIYDSEKNPYELAVADSHVTVIRLFKEWVIAEYIYMWISSPAVQLYIESKSEGSTKQKELYTQTIKNHLFPLPPLDEQHRIIYKYHALLPKINEYHIVETQYSNMETKFPERLKKSILQYAIQGKLVPQNPNDEPAFTLLERIHSEKEQMIKDGKIKRDKNESYIYRGSDNSYYEKKGTENICINEEIPFDIPANWAWSRIDTYTMLVTDYVANGSFSSLKANVKTHASKNYALFIRTTDLSNDFKKECMYIDEDSYNFLGKSKLYGGELLLPNIGASIGKTFIVPNFSIPMSLAPNAIAVKAYDLITTNFLKYIIASPFGANMLGDFTSGTAMPKFSKTQLRNCLIPIPPYSEQQKIIKHIEKIMNKF